jgi:hypothetical protein
MIRLAQSVLSLLILTAFHLSAFAKKREPPSLPAKILEARSVYLDCDCRKEMVVSLKNALPEMLDWGRFQIAEDRHTADLVFLFSANPYLGDYLTRDGPDKRPADVDFTILTVIDAHTGAALWIDSKRWGYMLVAKASRDLIRDLRGEMAEQVKRLAFDDILQCNHTPAYAAFASLTPEEALGKSEWHVESVSDMQDRLALSSPNAPLFCRQARLVVGPDHRIAAFEVVVSQVDDLDVGDVLQRGDQFDFTAGKDLQSGKLLFSARSKHNSVLIQFSMEGNRPVLSRVTYFY